MMKYWPTLSAITLVLAAVWLGSKNFDPFVFPSVPAIATAFWGIITTQLDQVGVTMMRYLVAFALAIFCGWVVGLLMGAFRQTFGRFMQALISIVQAVPALAWILFAVLWMQSVELRIGFVTFIIAFPFFVVAVYEGVRDMDRDMLEAIEQFRPNRMQTLRILLMPQSVTHLIIAMRSTAAMTLKLMVLAEVLAANNGIGRAMATAQGNFSIDQLFAWAVLLVLINFALIKIITLIEKRALRWRAEAVVR